MSPRRRLLLLALAPLALLAVAELGARVLVKRFTWRPLPPFGDAPEQREWLARKERELAAGAPPTGYTTFDPVLGWTTRPGYVSPDGAVHVNARGLRGRREYDELPPRGVRRVLAAGESFTFGEEVADAETWGAQLEERLGGEVLNYGVGGYGTDQAFLRLAREARGPAEAVVVGLMVENIGRNVNRYRPLWHPGTQPAAKPRYVVRPVGLELVPQPFASLAELVGAVRAERTPRVLAQHEYWNDGGPPGWLAWSTLARALAARPAYAARDLARLWRDEAGEPFRITLALLEAFRGPAQAAGGARLVVLLFPMRENLDDLLAGRAPYWLPLFGALDARGIEWVDASEPLLAEARATGSAALYREAHLAPRGNELVARALADRLEPPPGPR
jgi:hypothetical protein